MNPASPVLPAPLTDPVLTALEGVIALNDRVTVLEKALEHAFGLTWMQMIREARPLRPPDNNDGTLG